MPRAGGRRRDADGLVRPRPGRPRCPGPAHEADEAVQEHTARRARQRGGGPGQEHPQSLAEDPHPERPGERDGQRRADRRPEEQADPDEELDQREEGVPHRDVGGDEVPDVGDEVGDDEGWPWALARMMASTKLRPNMNGWNCKAASRIQKRPSTIWRARWDGTASGGRRGAAASLLLVLLPELVSTSMGLSQGTGPGRGVPVALAPPSCGASRADPERSKSGFMPLFGEPESRSARPR